MVKTIDLRTCPELVEAESFNIRVSICIQQTTYVIVGYITGLTWPESSDLAFTSAMVGFDGGDS